MSNHLKTPLILATLLVGAGAAQASAMSLRFIPDAHSVNAPPVVQVHSLHTNCQYNSVTPSGTGYPKSWHKTAEAGVHTNCPPPRKPGGSGELTLQPKSGNSGQLKLRK